jgi:tRNA-2-methylthio-N6-dimethylallyladenosine synthase
MKQSSFIIKTFGCQMNVRDSEIMAQLLAEKGYVESMDMDDADVVILNTCSIRAKAEQKAMSLLGMLRKAKKRRPGMKVCVAGCVAQQEGQELCQRMDHVDLVIGTQNLYELADLLEGLDGTSKVAISMSSSYEIPAFIPALPNLVSPAGSQDTSPSPPFRKFLTIMQGCNNYCTYCVVPYTRGREI